MKQFIIVISLCLVLGAFASEQSHIIIDKILNKFIDQSPKDLFKVWHHLFEKTYTLDSQEARQRFAIFKANLKEIKEHNAQDLPFKVGLNQFSDMTHEEFVEKMATRKPLKGAELEKLLEELKFTPLLDDDDDLTKRNLRSGYAPINYTRFFGPARAQLSCGSCWAFSTAGAIEGNLGKKAGAPVGYLSTQQLVDCNTENGGCSGGTSFKSYPYVKANGLQLESTYAYQAKVGTCQYNGSKVSARISDFVYCSNYVSDPAKKCSVDKAYTLLQRGPASVGIDASAPGFGAYKTGIFVSACANDNHAVILAGLGNDPTYGDYWIVRNSWGLTFGEAGYIKVKINPANKNSCFVDNELFVPIV